MRSVKPKLSLQLPITLGWEQLKFPLLPDAFPDPILITIPTGEIYYANPAWEKMTGYMLSEVKGRNPRFLKSGKTPPLVYKKMWQALDKGKIFSTEELVNKTKKGKEIQVHATYFAVKKDNNPTFYVQTFHDITHRKMLDKQKSAFLAIASHELKTPITTLKLMMQILMKKQATYGAVTENLLFMDQELTLLTELINDLLDISRIEDERMYLKFEEINIDDLILQVVRKGQLIAGSRKILYLERELHTVRGDRVRLEQVITNLLTNAIKYSPDKTIIKVEVVKKAKRVIVSVSDQGIGIAKDKLPFVFNRFYQVEHHAVNGFGLGLYISREIIKKHHGKIWVESAKGKGSVFSFSLPSFQ